MSLHVGLPHAMGTGGLLQDVLSILERFLELKIRILLVPLRT